MKRDRRPFIIEHCYSPEIIGLSWAGEWRVWSRYETVEARDEALRVLQRKSFKGLSFRAGEVLVSS